MGSPGARSDKTLRHFQCRDFLWDLFEEMSARLECSVDYLINEAMRQYARSHAPEPVEPRRPARPPPLPPPPPPPPPSTQPPPLPASLHVEVGGRRVAVTKTGFIIGRSAAAADLAIRDGNISRRHAVVVREPSGWVLRDLDSTNGILLLGKRVREKQIEDGDVFFLCDHELRFTFGDRSR
jgi:hypothetical protein